MAIFGSGAGNPGPAPQDTSGSGGRSHLIAGTKIVGDISAPGLLEIQGEVKGRVMADSVVIEERGTVGGIVRVHATARLSGTIRYDTLSIESGSEVTATCERAKAGA